MLTVGSTSEGRYDPPMAQWLVKEEPEHYSYDQLVKERKTVWAGVRNPLAQKHLRSIKKGDRIFYYHTGKEKAIVAIASAAERRLPRSERRDEESVRRGRGAGEEAGAAGDARRSQGRPRVRELPSGSDVAAIRHARQRRRVGAN